MLKCKSARPEPELQFPFFSGAFPQKTERRLAVQEWLLQTNVLLARERRHRVESRNSAVG